MHLGIQFMAYKFDKSDNEFVNLTLQRMSSFTSKACIEQIAGLR